MQQEHNLKPHTDESDVSLKLILIRSLVVGFAFVVLLLFIFDRHYQGIHLLKQGHLHELVSTIQVCVEHLGKVQYAHGGSNGDVEREVDRFVQSISERVLRRGEYIIIYSKNDSKKNLKNNKMRFYPKVLGGYGFSKVQREELAAQLENTSKKFSHTYETLSHDITIYSEPIPSLGLHVAVVSPLDDVLSGEQDLWAQVLIVSICIFIIFVASIIYYVRLMRTKNESLLREVHERRLAEEALRHSEERFDLSLSGSSQGLWDWALDTDRIWLDEHTARSMGLEVDDRGCVSTRHIMRLIHQSDRRTITRAVKSHQIRRKPFDVTFRVAQDRWMRARGQAIWNEDGRATRMAGSFMDITEQRVMEEQLQRAQKMDSLGLLAGGVAHDFNNLLLVILSYTEFAIEELDPEHPSVEFLNEVGLAGKRAADLTQQLLAFSRQQVIQPKPLDLNALVVELKGLLKSVIREDIEMNFDLSTDLGMVKIDRTQTEQVIINLCANARDAMVHGGILTLTTRDIFLKESRPGVASEIMPGRYIRFSVTDTGEGISKKTLERIFEPFYTTKPLGRGTGLGLATVLGIVQQQHGGIEVDSVIGVGSTFHVYLPFLDGDLDSINPEQAQDINMHGVGTILIAEDEPTVRTLTTRILERAGYKVLLAEDGEEAVAIFSSYHERIDLVLMDVVMPNMGGLEAYERMYEIDPNARFVFCSGYSGGATPTQFIEDLSLPILNKPYKKRTLLSFVSESLGGASVGEDKATAIP